MKRTLLLLITLLFIITGCFSEVIDQEDIDLSKLQYSSYLNDENPLVTINIKDYGHIQLQLFPEVARNTVNNFITYIQENSYNRSTFHRIIEDFMIQGGIIDNTYAPIKGEFISNGVNNQLSHYRGVISMARTSIFDSATSQFFIVHKDNDFLDSNYATFGGMINGFNVLDKIAQEQKDINDKPSKDIVIESMKVKLGSYIVEDVIYIS